MKSDLYKYLAQGFFSHNRSSVDACEAQTHEPNPNVLPKFVNLEPSQTFTLHYITCHLADAFIQSDLQ